MFRVLGSSSKGSLRERLRSKSSLARKSKTGGSLLQAKLSDESLEDTAHIVVDLHPLKPDEQGMPAEESDEKVGLGVE